MSAERSNGGPAFPGNRDMRHNPDWDSEPGMSLRDYFAAKAMQALVTGSSFDYGSWQMDAQAAYEIADAMLEARK